MKAPSNCTISSWDRRRFLTGIGLGASAFLTPGAFAEALQLTPRQTEGPFFPDKLPLDTDNDLIIINDSLTPAVGQVTHLSGVVRDVKGNPVRNALVEIWQVDGNGVYLHSQAPKEKQDKQFQGYGRFLTDSQGRYYFRTVKPVPYPGRTPHIHVAVSQKGKRVLTSQAYIMGEKQNEKDGIYRRLGEARQKLVTVDFQALPKSETNELVAKWDLVVGLTPEG
ncbi:protocatechuate 3,4-dioxygenase [Roseibacillus persicicus]|uniref:dioxygenase family protein n=1 Tax=Roseibacillus persicicus TaxID=454148 RepID=UPI00398B878D